MSEHDKALEALRTSSKVTDGITAMAWGIAGERGIDQHPTDADHALAGRAYAALAAAGFRVVKL